MTIKTLFKLIWRALPHRRACYQCERKFWTRERDEFCSAQCHDEWNYIPF